MSDIKALMEMVVRFRDARDWKQFNNPKDLALSLVLESAEVMEHFQWKNPSEIEEYLKSHKSDVGEELADVLYWVLLMGNDLGIDLVEAFTKKMVKNDKKYPISKSKGRHTKYTEL